jgi:hypothetical protein
VNGDQDVDTSEQSLGELVRSLGRDVTDILRKETDLARTELRDEAGRAARAGGVLGAAGAAVMLSLTFLAFAAAWALDEVMSRVAAFSIVGGAFALIAATLAARGRAMLRNVHPVPEETIETLKEDAQWAKTQLS